MGASIGTGLMLVLGACGGGSKISITCDIDGSDVNTCTEAKISATKSGAFQASCESEGGSVGFDPCSRSGYVGLCSDVSTGGVDANVYTYPSSTIQTTAGAMTACSNLGGKFTSADMIAASMPDMMSGTTSDMATTLPTGAKRVFVTSTTYQGDFARTSESNGDAVGDEKCQTAAAAAGLGGSFSAWLSDLETNAIDHVTGAGPWYRLDGTLVFNNRANLLTSPAAPIDVDENGHAFLGTVWTGTPRNGMGAGPAYNCEGWMTTNADKAYFGDSSSAAAWSQSDIDYCGTARGLYCFEN